MVVNDQVYTHTHTYIYMYIYIYVCTQMDHGNIRGNVNSDFSIVTMRRVAIIFFELGVVKNFMQKF